MGSSEKVRRLEAQEREDRTLIRRAERALSEIDRTEGLSDEHADVLAGLRLRLEGKPRASLEDLLQSTGDISGKRDLGDLLGSTEKSGSREWPEVEEKKKDWPEH